MKLATMLDVVTEDPAEGSSICFKVTIWLIGKLILQSSFRVYKVLRVHSHFRISPTSVSGTDGSQASPSCAHVLCS